MSDEEENHVPRVQIVGILEHEDGNYLENFGIPESSSASTAVTGESFCDCNVAPSGKTNCACGEEDNYHEWFWDPIHKSKSTRIHIDKKEVLFHVEYSCGTAAIRGSKPMENKQYYWEIKMMTPVYGTDMMVGVGTSHVNLDKHKFSFVSMLGLDSESWGLSYTGKIYHKGECHQYSPQFGQGSIIGIHLDMWNGTISYFKNRQPLGIAHTGLNGKTLYPMVSSTAARSGMKVIRSRSFESSLQFLCCSKLRQLIPADKSVLNEIDIPPGLKAFLDNNLSWLLSSSPLMDDCENKSSPSRQAPKISRKRTYSCHSPANDSNASNSKHSRT